MKTKHKLNPMKNIFLLLLLFTGMVEAQIVNIPDANLKSALLLANATNHYASMFDGSYVSIDINLDGEIQYSEAALITGTIDLSELPNNGLSVSNLTGIEAFTNMRSFVCSNNPIGILNTSLLPSTLSSLLCSNCNLTTLNVNPLPNLIVLACTENSLTSLDVSNHLLLYELYCTNNTLTSLNLSGSTALSQINCESNQLTTLNLSGLTSLYSLSCSFNNLSTLNLTGLSNLNSVTCSNNTIASIALNGLNQLQYLICNNNQLSAIDFSGLNNLQSVNCLNNIQLTVIDLSGHTSLTSVAIGSNDISNPSVNFTTVDLSGTSITNPIISLSIMDTLNLTNCANLVDLSLYTNVVSNVILTGCNAVQSLDLRCILTALDVSNMINLQYLNISGSNSIPSLDLSHNINLFSLKCDEYNPDTLDVSANINLTELVCASNNLKYLFMKNGSYELESAIEWTFGGCPNLLYACVDESQLPFIQSIPTYPATVIGTYCSFTPGGNYNTLSGNIKSDANNDGCDAGDLEMPYMRVDINDGSTIGASFTNNAGNYAFYTQAGNFEITPAIENPAWFIASPTTATIPFADNNNNTAAQDFCIAPNGMHPDIESVVYPIIWARPGFDAKYQIVYRNKGNIVMPAEPFGIILSYDIDKMDYVSSSQPITFQGSNSINFGYAALLPFESRSIEVTFHIHNPTDVSPVNIGDILTLTSGISPVNNDETITDNSFTLHQTVVGSFDPNDIICLEGPVVAASEIGNYLHYAINFENTGTFEAENVVVKTIVDTTKFDMNSLQLMNASHLVDARITGNKVEFIFKNIQLPIGGHGHILLKIKTQNTLVTGDVVANRGDIFFDYNFPIDTGLANTVFQTLSNSVFEVDSSVAVYPNPAVNDITIKADNKIKSIQLFDAQGRIILTSLKDDFESKLDISVYSKGIYFVKITTEKGSKVEKLIKQ